ncbi:ATP/GTP-binding protein [Streptomyces tsukubensis]|uniref:ATP/GTP-binding protein n=2 Tax=Streptomyces tsukubensis TaxID=83656 RepID=A0A7G3UN79_STRT9|nr:ATP/GTP-binding protein [Streptomyces tsukubensis NRRL18488]TAI42172.1 ATP/GTP-binding protein [Streptomyces tsukubensis]
MPPPMPAQPPAPGPAEDRARPAVPPPAAPAVPAVPGHAPVTRPAVADWLRTPRPPAAPGIWRPGHVPRPDEAPDLVPGRQLLSGALIAFLVGWLLWSLLWNGFLEGWWIFIDNWWLLPLKWLTPNEWTSPRSGNFGVFVALTNVYYGILLCLISVGMGRVGNWAEVWRRYGAPLWPLFVLIQSVWFDLRDIGEAFSPPRSWPVYASNVHYLLLALAVVAVVTRAGTWPVARRLPRRAEAGRPPAATGPESDPTTWPELRAAGLGDAAESLARAVHGGTLGDVDYARIRRAWQGVSARPDRLAAFTGAVRDHGPAACAHPSGVRDLPVRSALHDLATGQVRIGTAVDNERNPYARRTTGVALDPALLGTSLLAVGPSGSGKSVRLMRPVVESLCLHALANRAAVVAVTAYGSGLAPDDAFDLVIAVGRPGATHDLDLYGGSDDPDEAARTLAEALVGDLAATLPGGDGRRAATALAQLIGPYRSVHGRFPAVPELRELLSGSPAASGALRTALEARGGPEAAAQLRELDARERQSARADDIGVLLAERIAFLDRPAFAGSFRTDGSGRQFSLRAVEHPLRVRIDLPERGHAEASRIVARLVLAQFTEAAPARSDRSLFAALVLDDAAYTVTADSVRAVQRLRSANAGVVLALRTLEDVPEPLRGPLLGAVGCRMAFSGLAPWDGNRFAEAWGTEWVQTRDVTNRQIISDEPLTKALHMMRRLVTGRAATAEAVTVREVERARWSASDLAHQVPAGHAVLSLTTVGGDHTPPLLVDLRT